ncbi:MAG: hypothetical protein LQ343_001255 [Gyalolechia ehrenbergii]|nr:MAG: hypothetical protein LQ343_001255 [Gyalolechia ehrenbergii]
MATPEIKLPPPPQEPSSPASSDGGASNEQEHGLQAHPTKALTREGPSSNPKELDHIPIIYHYLTFSTELPSPSEPKYPIAASDEPTPLPPDLRRFISPFAWPESQKTYTIWLSCAVTVVTAYTAGSYSPATQQMMEVWHVGRTAIYVGLTTFTTGFATAPMFLAPFSEINGRKPVFIATGALFVICQLCCAVTRSYPGMLVARFFAGVGGSTFSTMVGGVVSDIYDTDDRNKPMALFAGAALLGTGLGPLCSGFVAQHLLWRWVFYIQVITSGILIILVAVFFRETRGSVLLSKRACSLNDWYEAREKVGLIGFNIQIQGDTKTESQRIRWKVKADEERESLAKMIGISVYRPFHLLTTEPVVFFFSLWVAFSWAVLYLTFSSVPLVFGTNHNFNIQQNGAVFTSMCIGAILSTILSIYQEKIAIHYGKLSSTPEGRLYFSCIESALMPIGLFWFGWSSFPQMHWIIPTIAIGCATMGIFSVYLAVFIYLADTYHQYASSALAAQSFCRNMLGGIFLLIANQMFTAMTYQGASSFLGGVGAVLTAVPWVLVFYGPRIRARSKFASEIMDLR